MAPLHVHDRPGRHAAGDWCVGGPPRAGRRTPRRGRHVVVVVRDPRLPASRPGRGAQAAGGRVRPRDVRRADPRARRQAGRAAGVDHPGRARPRVLRRLGIRERRGGAEDGRAAPARHRPPRAHADAHGPGRLPRRHVRGDERVRPGRRDAHDVRRGAAATGVRRPAAGVRGRRTRLGRDVPVTRRGARRRAGGDHRRAGAAGRGRDARLRPRLSAGDARGRRRARPRPRARRDRDRLRAHGHSLRRRSGGGLPRRDVRRQGAHRGLPHPGRSALQW